MHYDHNIRFPSFKMRLQCVEWKVELNSIARSVLYWIVLTDNISNPINTRINVIYGVIWFHQKYTYKRQTP